MILSIVGFFICTVQAQEGSYIIWENSKPVAVFISDSTLNLNHKTGHLSKDIAIRVNGSDITMFGSYAKVDSGLVFRPLIAFSKDILYQVIVDNQVVDQFYITSEESLYGRIPEVKIYPSSDILPLNILKFYIQFSLAMSEGTVYQHLHLLNKNGE